jgi:hypothetical protein
MPVMTHEVRWFFPGELARFPELRHWIKTAQPFPLDGAGVPSQPACLDGCSEVHVLIPGADDVSIRWRDGRLQIKGRMSRLGLQRFGRRFYGSVDVWAQWSHDGDEVKHAFGGWFARAPEAAWQTAAVRKTRIVRKMRLGANHGYVEVSAGIRPDRGLNVELTDFDVDGHRYCSLTLKAYPFDTTMAESFTEVVDAWLTGLKDSGVVLAEHQSMSFPEFLRSRSLIERTA